eukprot:1027630-Amphidinium_carterae.1
MAHDDKRCKAFTREKAHSNAIQRKLRGGSRLRAGAGGIECCGWVRQHQRLKLSGIRLVWQSESVLLGSAGC